MGCCISKCRLKSDFTEEDEEEEEELSYVQDKLVISHYPKKVSPIPPPNKENLIPIPDKVTRFPIPDKTQPSPPSPSKSSSFSSTLTCTTSNSTISSFSSSLSNVYSTLSSKERSFSNEFLVACYRENPHIVRINSIREASISLSTTKPPSPQRFSSPARPIKSPLASKQANSNSQRGINSSTLQKRVRSSSPDYGALTRQKSMRKEQERVITASSCAFPGGAKHLRSPSPSRRFGTGGSKVSPLGSISSSLRQESFRPANQRKIDSNGLRNCLKNRETQIHRISSKIDESVVKEVFSSKNDCVSMEEDVDNPLISLDCFIFL